MKAATRANTMMMMATTTATTTAATTGLIHFPPFQLTSFNDQLMDHNLQF
jgi:hypothetical protein